MGFRPPSEAFYCAYFSSGLGCRRHHSLLHVPHYSLRSSLRSLPSPRDGRRDHGGDAWSLELQERGGAERLGPEPCHSLSRATGSRRSISSCAARQTRSWGLSLSTLT